MEGAVVSAIGDVARAAGVSKSTASRALSGRGYVSAGTRDRVVEVAQSMGFVASTNAASLKSGQTRNVGVVIPFLNRWFFAELLEGIESALIAAGYDLTLYQVSPNSEQRRKLFEYFLVRKRVDAIVAIGIALTPPEVERLTALGKPIVGIGGEIEGIATLSIDDVGVSRIMTEHVIELGHTRIMHFAGDLTEKMDFGVHAQRLRGYHDAMADAGLEASYRETAFTTPGGYALAHAVLADAATRPTAIVAGCDEVAIGAIVAARELGIRVPEDLSVTGVDDHDLAEMFALTTVRQSPDRQGALAVELIMDELVRSVPARRGSPLAFPVEVVVRSSTAAPSVP
jgi:DNA-binding LacI/PurR family transcriptional regulator